MTALVPAGVARPVSATERAWIVAHDLFAPFNNQLVLEGAGPLDVPAWTRAVATATAANPGARAIARGWVGWTRWSPTGPVPPVRDVDGSAWSGRDPEGAPFLRTPLDPHRGPTTEVLLVRGAPPRVMFRTAHATMDGGGTLAFAADVFRALRGEPCLGHADTVTDLDLATRHPAPPRPPPPTDAVAATGMPGGPPATVVWRRVTVPGRPRPILGRVAVAVAAFARAQAGPDAVVRLDIPADLRRADPAVRSTANLTGIVSLQADPAWTPGDVSDAVRAALDAGQAEAGVKGLAFLRHVPLWLARAVARRSGARHHQTGRYGSTAVLSNVGRVPVEAFHGAGFTAQTGFWIPPGTPVTALFVGLSGTDDGVEIVATIPDTLASDGRLDALLDAMAAALTDP